MPNHTNHLRETIPLPIIIDSESIHGNKFARMYINELAGNIYDLLNDLSDKQLAAIERRSKKYTEKNTSLVNFFMKDAFKNIACHIIYERKQQRKKQSR